ncbi:MAG: cell division protein ZipA C-terminal FtsZ-binding domain-containing protein [Rhodoferax sp.]|uniref:cell division protein ZipA C-terminal FtsZ-binding domain-containing protein n=1 Tax=Rhodoferax sp. TaxID=50421 RepID=UPI0026050582|nr:cell division protein ZipA C-terminal FtsZ-binding domain-containing protein [Rhodoferax sp.]MDD2882351.1 cell division protein ZipA C-terminal FtsZ-binding domain-containing protein [Rhodoferax sp.]
MSQLQWGLIITGALVLLGVLAQNLWVARRNRPRQPEPVQPGHEGGVGEREPTLDTQAFEDSGFALPVPEKKPTLDALIDVIAPIALDGPVSGDAVLAAMPPTRRVGSKPFTIEGQAEGHLRWEFPVAGQRYLQLQAGIQLANRSGALNDIEFSEFVMKTQTFCDALGGTPDFPEMRQEVNRGRELDQFAGDHDAQLGFVVRARRAAWSPSYIQQMAAKLGFVPGSIAGRMVVPASAAGLPSVLSLSFDAQAALAEDPTQSALREVTLSLDVAQVDRSERAFERMREAAMSLARDMDGVITDDNGLALPTEALDVIASELEHLYDTLAQRELAAGSALARRLFS